jgi:hypothetical protein
MAIAIAVNTSIITGTDKVPAALLLLHCGLNLQVLAYAFATNFERGLVFLPATGGLYS